jgi:hypothetical protein
MLIIKYTLVLSLPHEACETVALSLSFLSVLLLQIFPNRLQLNVRSSLINSSDPE